MGLLDDILGSETLGNILGRGGSLVGSAGNALSLVADIEDAKGDKANKTKVGNLGIAAGSLGGISSLMGFGKGYQDFWGSRKKLRELKAVDTDNMSEDEKAAHKKALEKAENSKKGSIAGMIGGGAGLVSGIADIIGGMQKKKGGSGKAAGWVSNIAGLIGSGSGMAQGVYDYRAADSNKEKASAVNGIAGNAAGGLGGLLGLTGNILGEGKGDSWSMAGSVIGNGLGSLSNLIGTILG